MKFSRPLALLAVLAVGAGAGCSSGGSALSTRPAPRPVRLTAAQVSALTQLGSADTRFGLALLGQLCQARPGGNVAISPVSVATALGLAELGARGTTAAVIARAMDQASAGPAPTAALAARTALLASLDGPGITFSRSDRVWADPSLRTNPAYLAAVRAAVHAGVRQVPLLTQPETARRTINAAVAADTRGGVPELIPAGAMNPPPGWVLTDALYLNAAWQHPFDARMTAPGSFSAAAGQVTVGYLNGDGFPTAGAGGWQVAALPYRGGRLSLLALLPPLIASPPATPGPACQLPTAALLSTLAGGLAAGSGLAAISLPKVSLATSASLRQPLTALGMGLAFTGQADFSGLSRQACCIGFVQHAATLSVAERGTIASAATAVGVEPGAAMLPRLRFDRPYLLVLRDGLTGEPLMLAWVANPAGA